MLRAESVLTLRLVEIVIQTTVGITTFIHELLHGQLADWRSLPNLHFGLVLPKARPEVTSNVDLSPALAAFDSFYLVRALTGQIGADNAVAVRLAVVHLRVAVDLLRRLSALVEILHVRPGLRRE